MADAELPQAVGPKPAGRRAAKAPGAFRTISEVALELSVPQHVLRFWESKFPQIKPLKRGGGRRYYRPEDITLLRVIRGLLYDEGYTIRGVQKVLKEGGLKGPVAADVHDTDGDDRAVAVHAPAQPASHSTGLGAGQRRKLAEVLRQLGEIRGILKRAAK